MTSVETAWRGKADRAYTQLRADIESGALAPGQTLSEIELVSYTGASRTPVREAIRRLSAEGLVDLEPRRAPTVSRISLRSARDLFDFRRLLEPAAIRVVTQRAQHSDELRGLFVQVMETFVSLRNEEHSPAFSTRFLEATAHFDHLLATHTPNEFLGRSIMEARPHSARLRHIAHSDLSRLHESIEEHLEMCSALLSGDADRAATALIEHLTHVERAIFRQLIEGEARELLVT